MQSLDAQIAYLRDLASRQYPDDLEAQKEFLVAKLIEKLRSYDVMLEKARRREA